MGNIAVVRRSWSVAIIVAPHQRGFDPNRTFAAAAKWQPKKSSKRSNRERVKIFGDTGRARERSAHAF